MQAILTKYLPATDTRGSRIKAMCGRGGLTISYPHELGGAECHVEAVNQLVARFVKEYAKRYGTERNPWSKPRVCGQLPNGDYCHVSADPEKQLVIHLADRDDLRHLVNFAELSKTTQGTPAPLRCGLAASALKRATL